MISTFVLCSVLVVVAQTAVLSAGNNAAFETRIINGQLAQPNQLPWHAVIEGTHQNGNRTFCGGAIISPTFVLTAAHCIFGTTFEFFHVGLGTNNLSRPFITMEVNPINQNRVIHPQYSQINNLNDIGLLRLPITMPALAMIVPIRLPALSQSTAPFTNATAVISGFGRVSNTGNRSQGLRFTETRVLLQTECVQVFGNALANTNTMCTLGREFDVQGPCADDNGGPLIIYELNNIPTIIGLQSFLVQGGCMASQPAGYVRLGPFVQWISQNAGVPIRN